MPRSCAYLFVLLLLGTWSPGGAARARAEQGAAPPAKEEEGPGLVPFIRGAYLHQIAADIDDGGRYSVSRAAVQTGPAYLPGSGRLLALALGYRYDGYDFRGRGVFGLEPWDEVHTWSLTVPFKWALNDRWTLFGAPSVMSSAESGGRFEDSITGGAFGGFTYCFGPRLSIGPGVGVLSELEDTPSVFPILLVDWKISERWSLETGTGLGATQGPGLVLKYQPSDAWECSLGARYDRLRFRLDRDGTLPGGIGEDSSYGAIASIRYKFGPSRLLYVAAAVGFDFAGHLRLEDARGTTVAKEGHDPAFTVGLTAGIGF